MHILTHIRFKFWAPEAYTWAQIKEMQQLHALYRKHLESYTPIQSSMLALKDPNNFGCPKYSGICLQTQTQHTRTKTPCDALHLFAQSMVQSIALYLHRRQQRWYGKGHQNDPTQLLCAYLIRFAEDTLMQAAPDPHTREHLQNLSRFIHAVRTQNILQQEPKGNTSIALLLYNLNSTVQETINHIDYSLNLNAAREDFLKLKSHTQQMIGSALTCLFYIMRDRHTPACSFNPISVYTAIDSDANTHFSSQSGALLLALMGNHCVRDALLTYQTDVTFASNELNKKLQKHPRTPFVDEDGIPNPHLLSQLRASGSGIPVDLRKDEHVHAFIKRHHWVLLLAEYTQLIDSFWKLSGFGGDHLIYHHLADTVHKLMKELHMFITQFAAQFESFHNALKVDSNTMIERSARYKKNPPAWNTNYVTATEHIHSMNQAQATCTQLIDQILSKTQSTPDKYKRYYDANLAYQHIQGANQLINRARKCLDLPQTKVPDSPHVSTCTEAMHVPTNTQPIHTVPNTLPDILKTLTQLNTQQISTVMSYQVNINHPPKSSIWRGWWMRYHYFTQFKRLEPVFLAIHHLEQQPITLGNHIHDASTALQRLQHAKTCIKNERLTLRKNRQRLWWPFQRKTIRFLCVWDAVCVSCHQKLTHLIHTTQEQQQLAASLHQFTNVFSYGGTYNTTDHDVTQACQYLMDNPQMPTVQTAIKDCITQYLNRIDDTTWIASKQEQHIQKAITRLTDDHTTLTYYEKRLHPLADSDLVMKLLENSDFLAHLFNNTGLLTAQAHILTAFNQHLASSEKHERIKRYNQLTALNIPQFRVLTEQLRTQLSHLFSDPEKKDNQPPQNWTSARAARSHFLKQQKDFGRALTQKIQDQRSYHP